jgi:hypothetical protein
MNCVACDGTKCGIPAPGYALSADGTQTSPICSDPFCTNCISPGLCAACLTGYNLSPTGQCLADCTKNQVSNCGVCSNSLATCQQCSTNFVLGLRGTVCSAKCNDANCQYCPTATACAVCKVGFSNSTDKLGCAADVCSILYCDTCLNSTTCKTCAANYVLDAKGATCAPSCLSKVANC